MKDAPTKDERRFIQMALTAYRAHEAEPVRAFNKGAGADIRRLALDGLDDKAIAALTGSSVGSVTATLSRLRKQFGGKFHRKDISKMGLLIDLPDALRGALIAEAARLEVGVNTLANRLLEAALLAKQEVQA